MQPRTVAATSNETTMDDHTRTVGTEKTHAILALLRAAGLDTKDFHVEEHEASGPANMLGLDGGIVTIRCHSTGEERLYATGPGSAWFGALFMDLGWGHFGKAKRFAAHRTIEAA